MTAPIMIGFMVRNAYVISPAVQFDRINPIINTVPAVTSYPAFTAMSVNTAAQEDAINSFAQNTIQAAIQDLKMLPFDRDTGTSTIYGREGKTITGRTTFPGKMKANRRATGITNRPVVNVAASPYPSASFTATINSRSFPYFDFFNAFLE